jgi:2-dehydro-3-deoxygalactonokinase
MIAVDWGTSSFRAYLLGESGTVMERRAAPLGISAVPPGEFAATLRAQIGDWVEAGAAPVVMSGMIGSRQGWHEVPYAACPAGVDEIARGMVQVPLGDGRLAWIAPGLCCRDAVGTPDVMRGEEVQLLGVLETLGAGTHTVCLPGTHSKWARVDSGRIVSFATHMTGEVYGVLREHSILKRLMQEGPHQSDWFDEGVRRARDSGGLLHHVFGVRSRGLFEEIPAAGLSSYLSGILIGHELKSAVEMDSVVYVLGALELSELYARALDASGRKAILLDPDAVARGLFRLGSTVEHL